MKIAIVTFNLDLMAGGNRQIFAFAQELKKIGHAAVIYAPVINKNAFSELQRDLDIRTVMATGEMNWSYSSSSFIAKAINKINQYRTQVETSKRFAEAMDQDFDIVNCHTYAYPVQYFYKKRNPKTMAVFMMCEPPFAYLPKKNFLMDLGSRMYNWILDLMQRKYILASDVVAVLARHEKEWVEERGGKAVIVWSGLDFEKFYAPLRAHPGKGKTIKLFAVGVLNRYRHYEDAIEAVYLLREQGYDARLVIVANNIWHEDEYCQKLKTLLKEKNLEQYIDIRFSGVSETELKNLYDTSHVFVYTNYVPPGHNGATWALVVSEAMAAGMPVVLYKDVGAADPLTDGENAMLAETLNPEDIAKKLRILIDSPAVFEKIAKNGQDFVKKNISWEQYTKRILAAAEIK